MAIVSPKVRLNEAASRFRHYVFSDSACPMEPGGQCTVTHTKMKATSLSDRLRSPVSVDVHRLLSVRQIEGATAKAHDCVSNCFCKLLSYEEAKFCRE